MSNIYQSDIREILAGDTGTYILVQLLDSLEQFVQSNHPRILLRTRNEDDQPLTFGGTRYFKLILASRQRPVLSAGGVVIDPNGKPRPCMRFSEGNVFLSFVDARDKFPYHKPGWIIVKLNGSTIHLLPHLLNEQLNQSDGFPTTTIGAERALGFASEIPTTPPMSSEDVLPANSTPDTSSGNDNNSLVVGIFVTFGILFLFLGIVSYGWLALVGVFLILIGALASKDNPQGTDSSIHSIHGSLNPDLLCPHCGTRGQVYTRRVTQTKGISGSKVTGAILTSGLSILATGLSRHENQTRAYCGKCSSTWHF